MQRARRPVTPLAQILEGQTERPREAEQPLEVRGFEPELSAVHGPVRGDERGVDFLAVGKAHLSARGRHRPLVQMHAMPAPERARTRPDQRVSPRKSAAYTCLCRLADQARRLQVPEQIAAENSLGQRRLARPDRQMDLVTARKLLGDLKTRVAATDDEHRARADGIWCAIRGAV